MKSVPHLAILVCLFYFATFEDIKANEIKQISSARFVYWQAFKGTVEQDIRKDPTGKWFITTCIYKKDDFDRKDPKIRSVEISPKILSELLEFADNPDIQAFFTSSEYQVQPDGSTLELTVQLNRYGMTFTSQNCFEANASELDKRFGALFVSMMKYGEMVIP